MPWIAERSSGARPSISRFGTARRLVCDSTCRRSYDEDGLTTTPATTSGSVVSPSAPARTATSGASMRLSSSLWWPSALSSTGWTSSAPSIPRATIWECRIVATRGPNAFPSLFQSGPSLTGDFELRVRIGPLSSDATW